MSNKSKKAISNFKKLLKQLENISNVQQGNNYLGKLEKDREIIKYENNIEILKKENNKLKEAVNYQNEEKKQPTKNIVHLADSAKIEYDSNR